MDEKIEEDIKKQCAKFYPLQNILITKVKVLKKPRFDAARMNEYYGDKATASAALLVQTVDEPKNLMTEAPKK